MWSSAAWTTPAPCGAELSDRTSSIWCACWLALSSGCSTAHCQDKQYIQPAECRDMVQADRRLLCWPSPCGCSLPSIIWQDSIPATVLRSSIQQVLHWMLQYG